MPYPYETAGYPYGPATRFTISGVQPPADGYLGPSDQLSVRVLSPNAPISFNIGLRFLDLKGAVQPLLTAVAGPPTAGGEFVMPITISEGFLLSCVAFGASVKRGQCFVQLLILRQNAASALVVADVIFQGYISAADYVGYPVSKAESSISGRGFIRSLQIAAGALGSALTVTVPPGTRWRVYNITFTSNTAVVSGIPVILNFLDDLGNTILVVNSFTDAGATFQVEQFGGFPFTSFIINMQQYVTLLAGYSIVLVEGPPTDPSTTLGPMTIIVEEWVEV